MSKTPVFTLCCAKGRGQPANTAYPVDITVHSLADLLTAAKFDHTPGGFAGGKRSANTWRCTECVVLDVDNDAGGDITTPETVRRDFQGVYLYVVFSRHHMQPKGSKPAVPRFHVYFPIEFTGDAAQVQQLMNDVVTRFPYFDKNACDLARFFFGVESPEGEEIPGGLLLDEFMEQPPASMVREIPDGTRNSVMSAFAFAMLKKYGPEGLEEAETAFYQRAEDCNPPLSGGELSFIWQAAVKKAPAKIWDKPGYLPPAEYDLSGFTPVAGELLTLKVSDLSEVAEGELFAQNVTGGLLWNTSLDWLVWDGCRFAPDRSKARRLAQGFTARQLKAAVTEYRQAAGEAEKTPDNDALAAAAKKAKANLNFVQRCRQTNGLNHLLIEAAPHLAVSVDDLDADPFLLNTPAGLIDLRNGQMQPCDPAARCTKATAVAPGKEGAPLWREFLNTITCGDTALAEYLQEVAGMTALGKVYSETLLIATGDGGNGKSTFFNVLARVLGDYSGSISPDLLMTGGQSGTGAEVAALRGCRLAIAAETEEGQRLDSATVKRLCSTDRIAANPKYKDPFTFAPSHTLVLYTNFLPRVGSSDRGTWSRLTVLPFRAHLRDTDGERKDFAEILFTQAGGAVLSWIVEGARRFIAEGYTLTPPAVVCDALREYKQSCDWLGAFLDECAERGENYTVGSRDLYNRYTAHCQLSGEYRRDNRDFKNAMCAAGFESKHTMKGWIFTGLRLMPEFSPV